MRKEDLQFAYESFNASPDAINLWIGNHQSLSSIHKDHYENIYIVLRGQKKFTLLPPTDRPFLYQSLFPSASFFPISPDNSPPSPSPSSSSDHHEKREEDEEDGEREEDEELIAKYQSRRFGVKVKEEEGSEVPWMSVDPDHQPNPSPSLFPLFSHVPFFYHLFNSFKTEN